jgi:hypothetical protein
MNFINEDQRGNEQVELKYCERCGGLFLRDRQAGIIYCAGCTARTTTADWVDVTFPGDRRRLRPVRLPRGPRADKEELQGMATIASLNAVARGEARRC